MSDTSETIDRLEQWVEHWEDHQPEEFIADLRALLNTAKAAQRAAKIALGDNLILCLQGVEYPVATVTGAKFLRADTGPVQTEHGDGTISISPVWTVTKIELECTQPATMEPTP